MTIVVVLGAHRSGTSCVAGVLHQLGVCMGLQLMSAHSSNPKGHFEEIGLMPLNNDILSTFAELPDDLSRRIRGYVHTRIRQGNDFWGMKDPRFCFTLSYYHQHLVSGGVLKIVRVLRSLQSATRSLQYRDKITPTLANMIIQTHNQAAEAYLQLVEVPLFRVEYDDVIDDTQRIIKNLQSFVGIDGEIHDAVHFVSPDLRRF